MIVCIKLTFSYWFVKGATLMIKAIFFDVDGTLMSHKQKDVPKSTRDSLLQLNKKGIKVVIATGRHISELLELPVKDIQFDGYLTLNGQLLLDKARHAYAGTPIDRGEMEVLAQAFKSKHIPFKFIDENGIYINYLNDTVIDTQTSTQGAIPDIGNYGGGQIYQIVAFVTEDQKKILSTILDECKVTSWNETGIDIIPKQGGKSVGIQKYLDEEGLDRSEIMAFGDGDNDMEMLKFAGIGVAMGNANDNVKSVADYVTDSVDEDGIYKALKHFNLVD